MGEHSCEIPEEPESVSLEVMRQFSPSFLNWPDASSPWSLPELCAAEFRFIPTAGS